MNKEISHRDMMNISDQAESDLPVKLSNPARRALIAAGYLRLEQFTQVTPAELLRLHGMGPKGIDLLRQALEAKGLAFAGEK